MTQVLKGREAAAAFRPAADDLDLPDVGGGIFLVLPGVGRVMAAQAVPQVFHLPAIPIGARPDMLVIENLFLLRVVMTLVLVCSPLSIRGRPREVSTTGRSGDWARTPSRKDSAPAPLTASRDAPERVIRLSGDS